MNKLEMSLSNGLFQVLQYEKLWCPHKCIIYGVTCDHMMTKKPDMALIVIIYLGGVSIKNEGACKRSVGYQWITGGIILTNGLIVSKSQCRNFYRCR